MESKTRFLIPQTDWDAVPTDHFTPYESAPCHVTQLNGYVLCTLSNFVGEKLELFRSISGVIEFEAIEELVQWKEENTDVWPTNELVENV